MSIQKYFGVALITIALFLPVKALADPCEIQSTHSGDNASSFFSFIENLWASGTLSQETLNEYSTDLDSSNFYYTVYSDFSVVPICRSNGSVGRTNAAFYPVGLIVKPIHDQYIGQRMYTLVESEYGLRMYIRKHHLRPLDAGLIYFFADHEDPIPFCTSSIDRCDLEQEGENTNTLHPRSLHAVAERENVIGSITLNALDVCQYVEVKIYDRGGTLARSRALLPVCVADEDGRQGFDGRIKAVSYEQYAELFAINISAVHDRLSSSVIDRFFQSSDGLVVVNRKDCGIQDLESLELDAGVRGEIAIFIFSADAEARFIRQTTRMIGDGTFIRYSTYTIFDGRGEFIRLGPFTIQSIYTCGEEKIKPVRPLILSVYHSALFENDFSIDVRSLFETASTVNVNDVDLPEVAQALGQHKMFERGQFWRIRGFERYFVIRNSIELTLDEYHREELDILASDPDNIFERQRLRDLITHIMLVTSSQFG